MGKVPKELQGGDQGCPPVHSTPFHRGGVKTPSPNYPISDSRLQGRVLERGGVRIPTAAVLGLRVSP
eukprot:762089-Hanusia_phi.AAC.1